MKKYFTGMIAFLFVIALGSVYQANAQESGIYDFSGSVQIKVGKKKIKEEVSGTVDITMIEEDDEDMMKTKSSASRGDVSGGSMLETAVFSFEFGADDTECDDTQEEETIEVDAIPEEDMGGSHRGRVRIEFDQNTMSDVIGRVLDKYGATVQDALDLTDCFSTTGGGGEEIVEFWVSYVSGTMYFKKTYIKISFGGKAEIQVFDQNHENQQRYTQRISGTLKIPLE